MSGPPIFIGVDVGAERKGFHAVALQSGAYLDRRSSCSAEEMSSWCCELSANVVAIDSPCTWSADGRARPAERALMNEGVWCFSTPTRATALTHRTNHFGWVLAGEKLYKQLQQRGYALFAGGPLGNGGIVCETFPQAIACSLAGETVSARKKSSVRRRLLQAHEIETADLRNIDYVDAALCALTASCLRGGVYTAYGDAESGMIVVPGMPVA